MTDTKRLRELAEAVPENRKLVLEEWIYTLEDSGYFSCDEYNPQIAAFLEAANPEAVLGLIARIERLEAALRFYDAGPNCPQSNVAREALREET